MKRSIFLFVVILSACIIGTTAQAQFTNNPAATLTTNTTTFTPIGNGFGVALIGYGMPEYEANLCGGTGYSSNCLFFATPMGQPSAADATVSGGNYQFYVVTSDKDGNFASNHSDVVSYKVSIPTANPSTLNVIRTWVVKAETANAGTAQAASLAALGITRSGTVGVRADGTQSPNGNAAQQGLFTFDATALSTTIITQLVDSTALVTNTTVAATISMGSMGRNQGLLACSSFGNTQFVARVNIAGGTFLPHGQIFALDSSRGLVGINDTSRVLAYWKKNADEIAIGSASDVCRLLAVYYYNDNGTSISLDTTRGSGTGSNEFVFGTYTGTGFFDTINTNAINFFGATPFNGPVQISINDNGDLAFPATIGCIFVNQNENGTRSATNVAIIWKDANSGTFKKVVDNQDPSLFVQFPGYSSPSSTQYTNNLFSPPAIDNKGNVFFTAAYKNTIIGGTNYWNPFDITNAVYQSTPNTYPNPLSWTTRVLLTEGSTFTNPVSPTSNEVIEVSNLPLRSGGGSGSGIVPRAFGANSINRIPFSGTTNDLGGVIVCATLSNRTTQTRYDGLLYIAPLPYTPFVITAIAQGGGNVTVTWNGQPGSNIVQWANGGNYNTANYINIGTNILSGYTSTNFVHVGGAVVGSNAYYRIKRVFP